MDYAIAAAQLLGDRDYHLRCHADGTLDYLRVFDSGPIPSEAELRSAWTAYAPPRRWSAEEFIERLTMEEQLAILGSDDPMVRLFTAKLYAAGVVVADDPRTQQGMAYLVSKGFLTEERRQAILSRDA
jgi:hypothetical protein